MSKGNYSVPIRLSGNAAEKINVLSNLLEVSIQAITNKLVDSVVDEAIINTTKFLSTFDDKNKKAFLEIFNGTLEQLNKKKK